MTPLRLSCEQRKHHPVLLILSLGAYGLGGYATHAGLTRVTGIDDSALIVGAGFAAIGSIGLALWLWLWFRLRRCSVEVIADPPLLRLTLGGVVWQEAALAPATDRLRVRQLTKPRHGGGAWHTFLVELPRIPQPLFASDSRGPAERWARALSAASSIAVDDEVVSVTESAEIAAVRARVATLEAAGDDRGLADQLEPRTSALFGVPLASARNQLILAALERIGTVATVDRLRAFVRAGGARGELAAPTAAAIAGAATR